jgi:PKD repeat protein
MKKNISIRFFLCFLSLALVVGCSKQPFADYTYEPLDNPEIGEKIKFENLSIDAESYHWNFGDGQTSTEMSPVIEYSATGTFQVTLEALTKKKSDAYTEEIRIWPKTVLDLYTFEPDGTTPFASAKVSVYDTSLGEISGATQIYNGFTDDQGKATINHLDQKTYFVTVEKAVMEGWWVAGGNVTIRRMNEVNEYFGVAQLIPGE